MEMAKELRKCECEHIKHTHRTRLDGVHGYQAKRPDVTTVQTAYGRFNVCARCKQTCLAGHLEQGESGMGLQLLEIL